MRIFPPSFGGAVEGSTETEIVVAEANSENKLVNEEMELWRRIAGQRFVQHVGLDAGFDARLEERLAAIDEDQRAGLLQFRFKRHAFYVCASILAWVVFWDLADQNQNSILSRLLAWGTVLVAFWLARAV